MSVFGLICVFIATIVVRARFCEKKAHLCYWCAMVLDPQEAIECPIRQILGRVGGRWSLDVIIVLNTAPSQFLELARTIPGISRRMLALTLRGLERDGIVKRLSDGS